MSHPNTWAPLTWSELARVADQLAVIDATDGVTKTMIINELIKRTLATDDISVLSTIGIGATVPATDYLLLWEAATNQIKKLLQKDLMDRTLASVDVASWMTAFTGLSEVADDDILFWFDTSANQVKRLVTDELLRYIRIANNHHTANFTLTLADAYSRHTNRAATGIITCTLPVVPEKWRMRFFRQAAYPFRLDPAGTQSLAGGAVGKYLQIDLRGEVEIECIGNNEIEIIGGSALCSQET